jgi:hypothetical protein
LLALFATLVTVAAVFPPPVLAQAPDSALFHRGQWGVDFRIGGGFAGAGALHFTSPTHAILFDLSGAYRHSSYTDATPTVRATNGDGTLSLGLGSRSYHPLGAHLYRWTTLGASFLYDRQSSTTQDTVTQTSQGLGAGVFVNIGATWLVTPHLGLGAQWQVDLTYTHNSVSSTSYGSGTSDNVTVGLARVALTGQLYF